MKKYLFLFFVLLFSLTLVAQDRNSAAYDTGYAVGKIVGLVLIAGFVIWGIFRWGKKK